MSDKAFYTIQFKDNKVVMLDQRKLQTVEEYFICENYKDVVFAIKEMVIRGAPAIGVAAAFGIALFAVQCKSKDTLIADFDNICKEFAESRPTAVNLFWAIDEMKKIFDKIKNLPIFEIQEKLFEKSMEIFENDIETNRQIGKFGNEIIKNNSNILTHCNAGALATAGYGTALGVIRAAHYSGKNIHVFADETRPFLQGARLTAWELQKENIPCTLICDNMAGYLMNQGRVDVVVVGADRIASNGDTANKIGTYSISVLAKENNIPFYIAAPISTFDFNIDNGEQIPIEERDKREVTHINLQQIAPDNINVFNPAFDVTPNENITGFITEKGILKPPFNI
jgi:methylthioribose-1-phosphate isomerase